MVRLDPFFSFGFSSVYQHGWVFDIFWRSGLTFWCSMSFSDCKINKSQVYTIKPQLKDLKPCHVQIGGLPRLNSKASGCGPQPTAHWCLQHLQLKLGSDVSPKKNKTAVLMIPQKHMGVSKNRGTPKSSILIRFSIINNPFWGTPIFGNIHMIQTQPIIEKSWFKRLLDSSLLSCLHFGLGWSCHQCPVVNSK